MRTRTKVLIGSAIVVGVTGSAVGVGIAGGADDEGADALLAGNALDQATAAALAHVGGGDVIETETGDGGSAYGVEIRKDDGSVVEISLDASFKVIGTESDDDGPGADETSG